MATQFNLVECSTEVEIQEVVALCEKEGYKTSVQGMFVYYW